MEEKRRFVRIDWPVIVKYKVLDEPKTEDRCVGKNISEGGLSFPIYERVSKGNSLSLEIELPFDSMPIFAKGTVAWVKEVGQRPTRFFEVGIEFRDISLADRKRLKNYIANEIKGITKM